MRKKLIILTLMLIGSLGLNLIAADSFGVYTASASCQEGNHSLTASPHNTLQWDDLGLRHLLPTGCKSPTSHSLAGRTQSCCGTSRATQQTTPVPSRHCVTAAILPNCTADYYVYRLLRLRL